MSQCNRDLLIRAKKNASMALENRRKVARSKSAARTAYRTKNLDADGNSADSIKSLLMLRLKANQDKNTAMQEMGKKPLSQQQREKIDLKHQLVAGRELLKDEANQDLG